MTSFLYVMTRKSELPQKNMFNCMWQNNSAPSMRCEGTAGYVGNAISRSTNIWHLFHNTVVFSSHCSDIWSAKGLSKLLSFFRIVEQGS